MRKLTALVLFLFLSVANAGNYFFNWYVPLFPSVSNTTGGGITSIATTSPITGGPITTTGTIGIQVANAVQDGYLTSVDWSTFNGKASSGASAICAYGIANFSIDTSGASATCASQQGTVTSISTSAPLSGGPITGSGTISIPKATASVDGYLGSVDFAAFSGKAATGNAACSAGSMLTSVNSSSSAVSSSCQSVESASGWRLISAPTIPIGPDFALNSNDVSYSYKTTGQAYWLPSYYRESIFEEMNRPTTTYNSVGEITQNTADAGIADSINIATTTSNATRYYLNCSKVANGTVIYVNGSGGFNVGSGQQIVATICANETYLYVISSTSYYIINGTTLSPMHVIQGNVSSYNAATMYSNAGILYNWNFETVDSNNITQSSATANNATLKALAAGSSIAGDVQGKIGRARNFSNVINKSYALPTTNLPSGSFTLMHWQNLNYSAGSTNYGVYGANEGGTIIEGPGDNLGMYYFQWSSTAYIISASGKVAAGRWDFVVSTYSSTLTQGRLYVNAENQTATVSQGARSNPVQKLLIGAWEYFTGGDGTDKARFYFGGALDEFRIYNRYLEQTEVNQTYENAMGTAGYGMLSGAESTSTAIGTDAMIVVSGTTDTTKSIINITKFSGFEARIKLSDTENQTTIVGIFKTGTNQVITNLTGVFWVYNNTGTGAATNWALYCCNAGACTSNASTVAGDTSYHILTLATNTSWNSTAGTPANIQIQGLIDSNNFNTCTTNIPSIEVASAGVWTETEAHNVRNTRVDYIYFSEMR